MMVHASAVPPAVTADESVPVMVNRGPAGLLSGATTMSRRSVPSVQRAIVHRVHQRRDAVTQVDPPPILADLVSPLDPAVERFLADHIVRSLDDYRARRSRFVVA